VSWEKQKEHEEASNKVVEQVRKLVRKFNLKKLQYEKNELRFLGMIFSVEGIIKPNQEKFYNYYCVIINL